MNKLLKILVLTLIILGTNSVKANPSYQNANQNLKVFLEGTDIDFDFIRRNISRVDFVQIPDVADVHIIINRRVTGSGGWNYTLSYYSKTIESVGDFTLSCFTEPDDTDNTRRMTVLRTMKMGLMPYVNETMGSESFDIQKVDDESEPEREPTENEDPWRSWVFRCDVSGSFDYEELKDRSNVYGSARSDKVTEKWKYRLRYNYSNRSVTNRNKKDTLFTRNVSQTFSAKMVYSLTDKWSTGVSYYLWSSTYLNTQMGSKVKLGFEYNIFPWDISHEKLFTVGYYLGPQYYEYFKPTYYVDHSQWVMEHSLRANMELVQPWGEVNTWLGGEQFINLGDKYELSAGADLSVRVAKGFSIRFDIRFASVYNQIYLAAEEISDTDILLNTKKLPSTIDFKTGLGIRYQFGSVYNNVVNNRM